MATNVGTNGNDKIIGKSFAEKLFGKGGNDLIKGNGGNDQIDGGTGNDNLYGGTGGDKFVFAKNSGKDVINDFNTKSDVLVIAKGLNGIKTVAGVVSHAKKVGADVVIDLGGGNKITLKGVSLTDFKKNPGDHIDVV